MEFADLSSPPRTISRIQTSDGELVLRAHERGEGEPPAYEVIFNGTFLTSTRNHFSEGQLARIALQRVRPVAGLRVLIGGLGIGYTLSEVLSDPHVIRADVVEISVDLIGWARMHFAPYNRHALEDPRVHVIQADLLAFIGRCRSLYDALLLDVDNGPTWPVIDRNRALYERSSLRALRNLLRPEGVLAVWSWEQSTPFAHRLRDVFGVAEEWAVDEPDGSRTYVYTATPPGVDLTEGEPSMRS